MSTPSDMNSDMNHVERFRAVTDFQPVDRLPRWEWAMWWDQTPPHVTIEEYRLYRRLLDQYTAAAG